MNKAIIELRAENFKKLKAISIRPDGNLVQLTGRNGQGKTSVLDSIFFALKGQKALPLKPVRKGTERLKVVLELDECIVTRTLSADSTTSQLALEMKGNHKRDRTPQDFLDQLYGALTFDPLAFVQMDNKGKIEELNRTAKTGIDFEAIEAENAEDFKARGVVNKELKAMEARHNAMETLEGLPEKKIDEQKIMDQLNAAGEENAKAQDVFKAKQALGAAAAQLGVRHVECERGLEAIRTKMKLLEQQLKQALQELKEGEKVIKQVALDWKAADKAFHEAPEGQLVDVAALTTELASAQRTNRAIEQRDAKAALYAEIDAKRKESYAYTDRIDRRMEKKRDALVNAKIPVEGLTFDERQVLYKGIPIENLGEGEQIRISAEIGMAANPKLRVMCIRHGEALDEDGLKILADLAEAHDFQIWMARVDSSGKVGIVLEDGMIAGSNETTG